MRYPSLLATSLLLLLAGCGAHSGETNDSTSRDEADSQQQAERPSGEHREGLRISARTYTTGTVKAKVSGFFAVDGTQQLNKPASTTDEDQTWIQYGASGAPELNVLFTNSTAMAENGLNIGVGPYTVTATSTSGECKTRFDIKPATVTGHYSCTGSTGYNNKTGQMGKVDIEVDFEAAS